MNSTNAERLFAISVDDYLHGEENARRKHEFVDGMIYAMVGGRYNHNLIASNVLGVFHSQLKGSPCRALNSDSKVRVEAGSRTRFYYPDVSVICGDNIRDGVFQDRPTVVVEVLSRSTRRVDEGEKLDAYLSLESLSTYILLEQDLAAAKIYHRDNDNFSHHIIEGLNAAFQLPAIGVEIALADVYANVKFSSEPDPAE
jgi:Uma2 family endonuclease